MLEAVRPAWWVLRACVAVSLLDAPGRTRGRTSRVLAHARACPVLGPVLLRLVAVVLSVRVGQGKLWPGSGPGPLPCWRGLVLAGLNPIVAILAPLTFHFPDSRPYVVETVYDGGGGSGPGWAQTPTHGRSSAVVATWSATSTPTTPRGSRSRACSSSTRRADPSPSPPASSMGVGADRQVTCLWFNGTTPLFNVFPLPAACPALRHLPRQDRPREGGCCRASDEPPLASVPPATLPAGPQG